MELRGCQIERKRRKREEGKMKKKKPNSKTLTKMLIRCCIDIHHIALMMLNLDLNATTKLSVT